MAVILLIVKLASRNLSKNDLIFHPQGTSINVAPPNPNDPNAFYRIKINKERFSFLPQTVDVFPKSLLGKKQWINKISIILKDLGFSGNPIEKQDQEGIYYWQKGNNYLILDSTNQTLTFTGSAKLTGSNLSSSEIKSLVVGKMTDWGLINKDDQNEMGGFVEFGQNLDPVSDLTLASTYRIVFSLTVNDFPLVDRNTVNPLCEVRVTKNGSLALLRCRVLAISQETKTTEAITDYDKMVSELNNNKGTIIEAVGSNGEIFTPLPVDNLAHIEVFEVSLAYDASATKEKYLPVYIFKGTALTKNNHEYQVKIALSAIND